MAYFQAPSPAAHEILPDLLLEPNPDDYNHEPQWMGVTGEIPLNFLKKNTSAARCPSPWTDYPPFSPPMNTFGSSAFDQEAHLSSESSASLHTSSGCSSQKNSLFERESYYDSSTPGTAQHAISPSPTISSLYSDTYVPPYPLPGPNPTLDMNYGGDGYGTGCTGCDHIGAVEPSATVTGPDALYLASMSGSQTSMTPGLTFDSGYTNVDMLTDKSMGELESNNEAGKRSTSRKPKSARTGKPSPTLSKQSTGRIEKASIRGRSSTSLTKNKAKSCSNCNASFKDNQSLEKHVKTKHTRPFICIFHYAGCDANFASKNEWKRHVVSQHLYLEYYHCQYAECANAKPPSSQYRCSTLPQHGGIFNRKDLYTQHLRRMHQPRDSDERACAIWEDQIKNMQDSARETRCELPQFMNCPAGNCNEHFVGQRAWDDRMEHVARHLERAAEGMEPRLSFGGAHDTTLSHWAESPAVNVVRRVSGGWKLNNPVRQKGDDDMSNIKLEESDEDAEGEENFPPGAFEHPFH